MSLLAEARFTPGEPGWRVISALNRRASGPVWIASTWVPDDTSMSCFWSAAPTKAPRSGSTVGSNFGQLLDWVTARAARLGD